MAVMGEMENLYILEMEGARNRGGGWLYNGGGGGGGGFGFIMGDRKF